MASPFAVRSFRFQWPADLVTSWAFEMEALILATGFVHSFCITPLPAVMLRSSEEGMRGRVMGVRMLAIWGLPLGLLLAGIGYVATTALYGSLGLLATLAIGYGWRRALWHRSAAANAAYAG